MNFPVSTVLSESHRFLYVVFLLLLGSKYKVSDLVLFFKVYLLNSRGQQMAVI